MSYSQKLADPRWIAMRDQVLQRDGLEFQAGAHARDSPGVCRRLEAQNQAATCRALFTQTGERRG